MKFNNKIKVSNVNRIVSLPKHRINVKPSSVDITKINLRPKSLKSIVNQPVVKQKVSKPIEKKIERQARTQNIARAPKINFAHGGTSEDQKAKLKNLLDYGVGKYLVIIGNGPSLNEVDTPKIARHPKIDTMSINTPDYRIWPTTHWLFCDSSQYKRHKAIFDSYNGNIITTSIINSRRSNHYHVRSIGGMGFSTNLQNGFNIGRSSVYAAMQVANYMNYDHIYMIGVDMCSIKVDGVEKIWNYGANPDVKPDIRVGRFDGEAKHYDNAGNILDFETRSKFTFCSSYLSYPFVNKFNKLNHLDFVDEVLKKCQV